jgi:hypothetical protein
VAMLTLAERGALGSMQRRVGPVAAGLFGLIQPIWDGLKLGLLVWSLPTCASAAVVGLLWLACFRCGPGCYGLPVLVLLGGVVGTTLSSLLRSEVYESASRFDAASFSPDPPYNGLITAHAVFPFTAGYSTSDQFLDRPPACRVQVGSTRGKRPALIPGAAVPKMVTAMARGWASPPHDRQRQHGPARPSPHPTAKGCLVLVLSLLLPSLATFTAATVRSSPSGMVHRLIPPSVPIRPVGSFEMIASEDSTLRVCGVCPFGFAPGFWIAAVLSLADRSQRHCTLSREAMNHTLGE